MWNVAFLVFGLLSSGIHARAVVLCDMTCLVDHGFVVSADETFQSWSAIACVHESEINHNQTNRSISIYRNRSIFSVIETALFTSFALLSNVSHIPWSKIKRSIVLTSYQHTYGEWILLNWRIKTHF